MLSIGSFADKPSIAMEKSLTLVGRALLKEAHRKELIETGSIQTAGHRSLHETPAIALVVVTEPNPNCHQGLTPI